MNIPIIPGPEPITVDGRPVADMIDELMEELDMAGRHGVPSTGDGKSAKGPKPARTQVAITSPGGAVNHKKTASLFSKLLPKWDGKTK